MYDLHKANEIYNTYKDIKKMQEAVMFLQKYDISIAIRSNNGAFRKQIR